MATLVVSDLHIGTLACVDLLRRDELRAVLVERLRDGIDRLVVLGDALELREAPVHQVVEIAEPVFADLGRVVDEIVLVGGNHDHNLLAGWIDQHCAQLVAAQQVDARQRPDVQVRDDERVQGAER